MSAVKRLLVIVGGGLAGLFLVVFGCKQFLETKSLQSKGKTTVGEVTDAEERSGRRGRHKYYVTASFKTEGGASLTSRERVAKAIYEDATATRKINVTYLPNKPTVSRFGSEVKSDFLGVGMGVAMIGFAGFTAIRRNQ